ncbi:carbon-nitrogen hydrolase family protein [Lutibaculum baratangense]|uniref:Omega amidase n=1 Tax=Lutibaculum baratangense AMV1 TaxID=631454 RepID=V4RVE7_9HYPH|nr:carbon-nitrogen hydrolase family protein [Lutibaculum baratangense]ESR27020.1 Omega amidase [Lutibaculum baratangense AMV1]
MKIATLQMNTQDDKAANIAQAVSLIETAVEAERPDLVVLPETFTYMGGTHESRMAAAETFPDGEAYRAMQEQARKHGIFVHAGSMNERADGNKSFNTTVVFDRSGTEVARYRKIHLFDVDTPGGLTYLESETVKRGEDIVTYDCEGVTVGCTICYDLRFPELYAKLAAAGAQVIMVPAAFTLQTGKDHWEVLLRARAIETQTYVVACGQIFTHDNGKRPCYGHSMIVDPWGTKVADCSDQVGFAAARIDIGYLEKVRGSMPVAKHHVLV